MTTTEAGLDRHVDAVRGFNRFWRRRIGVLGEGYLQSRFSVAEVRVLYELAHGGEETSASKLKEELGLDAGYLSRILRGFEERGLISKKPSALDAQRSLLRLTGAGREAFAPLDARSREEIGAMLDSLSATERDRLVEALGTVERLLRDPREPGVPYLLRPHRPGDVGWVVHRHGMLYARE